MGILGRSSKGETNVVVDPFEIYEDGLSDLKDCAPKVPLAASSVQVVSNIEGKKNTTKHRTKELAGKPSGRWRITASRFVWHPSALMVLAGLSCFSAYIGKPWSYFGRPDLVYAYFEVRALDSTGRPIAGATVKNGGKQVGTTDSFGEWRRYMQVPLGGVVPITLVKKTNQQQLLVTKNFAVPPTKPERSEIELRSSLQLSPEGIHQVLKNTGATQGEKMQHLNQANTSYGDVLSELTRSHIDKSEVLSKPEKAELNSSQDPLQSKSLVQDLISDRDAVWIDVVEPNPGELTRKVLPILIQKTKELGLRLERNAPWTIKLTSLIEKPGRIARDGGGLFRVTSTIRENDKEQALEVLKNFQSDPQHTVGVILHSLAGAARKKVLIVKSDHRWVAVLPRKASKIWALTPGATLNVTGQAIKLTHEAFASKEFKGYFIKKDNGLVCSSGAMNCILIQL